jgi:hypothetical protein
LNAWQNAAKLRPNGMAARKKKTSGVEWVGGLLEMPAYVTGEGEPYRPGVIFWMGEDGALLGTAIAKPSELLAQAVDSLKSTIEQPLFGRAHTPSRLRVASRDLYEVLREAFPAIEVTCAPTPEMDVVLESLLEEMNEDAEGDQSYLEGGVSAGSVAAFFAATAALYRLKLWSIASPSLVSVTIEALGVRDAALALAGEKDEGFGVLLFATPRDFDAHLVQSKAGPLADPKRIPAHYSLSFERGEEIPPSLRGEVAEHHWEIADQDAYPWLVMLDAGLEARAPTGKEMRIVEAITRAFATADKTSMSAAWRGGAPFAGTYMVETHGGEVEVTLRVPHPRTGQKDGLLN